MPELPEVEVVRQGLQRWVTGRTIDRVDVLHPRPVRRHVAGPDDFAARLSGAAVSDVVRRGKYLWLELDTGEALLAHLGMSGQLLMSNPGTEPQRHLRATLTFSDGGPEVRFADQRMFGGLAVVPLVPTPDGLPGGTGGERTPSKPAIPAEVAHIGRDLLDPFFDEPATVERLRRKRTGVKRALLDQTLVSGVGNIYADEALWRSRLHYARPTDALTRPAARALLGNVRDVMNEALEQGGTSFDALYVNVNGESGYFDRSLAVYGQEDEPCPRCGTPVRRDAFMNRSSFTCPKCQPRPRNGRW
ncbi:MAG TPA: bifunctional DNA-formamidopyrimidine glycosylase/DNA-(apurinic or apyrimidinic site) lyase [Actinomycetales bacterium]|nr:bifunctional DNA-formamidopyrimidine glycosylase/DNA-(apurinic or apyrimidinic site) lyase [Actinomycetales bacterium]